MFLVKVPEALEQLTQSHRMKGQKWDFHSQAHQMTWLLAASLRQTNSPWGGGRAFQEEGRARAEA